MSVRRVLQTGALVTVMMAVLGQVSQAANECRVEYGFNDGRGHHNKTTVNLNAGETRSINQDHMDYVKNVGTNKVKVFLKGVGIPIAGDRVRELSTNQQEPWPAWFVESTAKLDKLECLGQASAGFGSPEALIQQLRNTLPLDQIAKQIRDTFHKSEAEIAQLLKNAGFPVDQVAAALAKAFNMGAQQVAAALKSAGYAADQVASALKAQFNATAEQVATVLKAAGYAADQVAAALRAAFNATLEQAAAALKAGGYSAEQVAKALKVAFNATAAQVAKQLKATFSITAKVIAQILKNVGYTLIQVGNALDSIGENPEQVLTILQQTFHPTCKDLLKAWKELYAKAKVGLQCIIACDRNAQVLKDLGYQAVEVLEAMRIVFNISKEVATEIAQKVFGLTGEALAQALKDAGYAAAAAGKTLKMPGKY